MSNEYTSLWDTKVRKAALNVIRQSTVDKECIEEYVGRMVRAVEHDIAYGRCPGLNSLNCLMQVKGVFSRNNPTYFKNIHQNTSTEEIERMYELSDMIKEMLETT